jgi:hypothetical protein
MPDPRQSIVGAVMMRLDAKNIARHGYHSHNRQSAQATPKLALKIKMVPTSNATTISGLNRDFSRRENSRNFVDGGH